MKILCVWFLVENIYLPLEWLINFIFQDKRNFLRNPPAGVQFQFDFESMFPIAMATLQEDANLNKMRFDLVPKQYVDFQLKHFS